VDLSIVFSYVYQAGSNRQVPRPQIQGQKGQIQGQIQGLVGFGLGNSSQLLEKNLILESIANSRVLPQASNGANLMRLQWSRFWVYIINYVL
jgi:hypothetical protein